MLVTLGPTERGADAVLSDAFAMFGCARPGGASEDGWSKISDYLRCPYRYYLKHELLLQVPMVAGMGSDALDIGSYTHVLLAAFYGRMLSEGYPGYDPKMPDPRELIEAIRAAGPNLSALAEAERLYDGYMEHYGDDEILTPVAVEMPCGIVGTHTSRLDLVAHVRDGLHDGLWIIEHKTGSPRTDLDLWRHDGEVFGEMYSWKLSDFDSLFGEPCLGVCINLMVKSKPSPIYHRQWLTFPPALREEFEKHRAHYRAMVDFYHRGGYWPKSYFGCAARFGRCSYWDHCVSLDMSVLVPIE